VGGYGAEPDGEIALAQHALVEGVAVGAGQKEERQKGRAAHPSGEE